MQTRPPASALHVPCVALVAAGRPKYNIIDKVNIPIILFHFLYLIKFNILLMGRLYAQKKIENIDNF